MKIHSVYIFVSIFLCSSLLGQNITFEPDANGLLPDGSIACVIRDSS